MFSPLIFKTLIIFLSQLLLLVSAQDDGKCSPSFNCGYLGLIKFPFTTTKQPHCGLLAIHGCEEHDPYAPKTVKLSNSTSRSYTVLQVEPRTIGILDEKQDHYLKTRNCTIFTGVNFTLPHTSPLASFHIKYNITIFRCNHSLKIVTFPKYFYRYSNCPEYDIYYGLPNTETPLGFKWPSSLAPCSTTQLAVDKISTRNPFQFLSGIMIIEVRLSDECERCLLDGKNRCLLDSKGKFYCARGNKNLAWILGLGIGLPGIIIIGLLIIWHCKPRYVSDFYSNPYPESASIYSGVPVFTFKDLEIATKCFDSSRELGEGGFGIVYYGKLQDGREVAVKRLYENNYRRVEQFMNEIKILMNLRHTNLVSLYGSTSRHSRELLLVYEYISNGTVASHLHHYGSTNTGFLPWPIRMKVAIETATALAYLHASDIIHRDVKTNNILLDNTFCVKVADFGLSRLFPNDVTHVSTAPQGTPGYVDPEYHRCYQLTNKSDVYSFGVVLIELISSMPPIDLTRHKDEINLADLAIRKIQKSALAELVNPSLGYDSNSDVKRQITSVAELAFHNISQALEGVQMILNMSNNKRVDCELLERITKEVEKRLSTSNVPPLITDNKPKTDQFCIVDPGSENQEQVSGASVTGRSRETEQLLLLLGKVLQQIIKTGSGCGPEIWGLYAKWHRINGDLMMCSEALLKQVRSLQGSDTWKDRDRFKKFAKVSLELCQVYVEFFSSTGSIKQLSTAEMHLKNVIRQAQSFTDTEEFRDLQACYDEVKIKLQSNSMPS